MFDHTHPCLNLVKQQIVTPKTLARTKHGVNQMIHCGDIAI